MTRVVFDTNVLISAALSPKGTSRKAVDYAVRTQQLLLSKATYAELADVLDRPHLQRYLSAGSKAEFTSRLMTLGEWIEPSERIAACRDPKDDKFLELAVAGKAEYLVSGDQDLLVLHPFRDILILSPQAFLAAVVS
ncbi:MAG: putative toxin-antitoxin system toxin component, PIN family [Bacteroidota bacterium]